MAESEELQDVASAPSLAGAMPARIVRNLERRKSRIPRRESRLLEPPEQRTPVKGTRAGEKENDFGTPQRRKSVGTPMALGTPGGTPSRCVVEVERMRQRREEKRMHHDRVRADLACCDEGHEFRQMIDTWRQEHARRLQSEGPREVEHIMDDDQRLRVCLRKRPLLALEQAEGNLDVLSLVDSGRAVLHETRRRVDMTRILDNHSFQLDGCFGAADTNEAIYSSACRPLVHAAFDGKHATVFAYGQTGSGKTHTMMGGGEDAAEGLYSLAASDCFSMLETQAFDHLALSVSFFEIYREAAFDLIPVSSPRSSSDVIGRPVDDALSGAPMKLQVLEDASGEVQLVGLSEHSAEDTATVLSLLRRAHSVRRTGNNSVNERSSRSHALMQLFLRNAATGTLHGKLTLVDLAGSERAADTLDANRQARSEGADINRSLLCLKECIRALDAGSSHVPFRGSKLTHILRDSFAAADSRTAMLVHVSPTARATEQSLNSLRYAERLKAANARFAQLGSAPQSNRTPSRSRLRASVVFPCENTNQPSMPCESPPLPDFYSLGEGGHEEEGSHESESRPVNVELCHKMLLSVVDCLYDPEGWSAERALLEEDGASMSALKVHGQRIEQILEERIELFINLRKKIGAWSQSVTG